MKPLFTSSTYVADGVQHCSCGHMSTVDMPCYGKVERLPGWDVLFCEGHQPGGEYYVPEKLQEGGDIAEVAAADAGQQTFLTPEQEVEVLRAKVEALKRENAAHIEARQVNVRALNKMAAEVATLRADAQVVQAPDPQLIRPPDVSPVDLHFIATKAHELSHHSFSYVHAGCRNSYNVRIALLELRRAVEFAVARAIPNHTRLRIDLKEDGYWLHIDSEGKKASLNLGGGHGPIVAATLEAAVRQTQ